jgi:hemerythrin-like domain-containing protein
MRIHKGLPLNGNNETWIRGQAARAREFFADEIVSHFKAEEEVLFPVIRESVGECRLLSELLSEHRKLKTLSERLRGTEVQQLLSALSHFADQLEMHIRKEERELFPLYERLVTVEVAMEVGSEVRAIVGEAMQPGNPELLK